MHIQLSPLRSLNLDATLCCGQAFRWVKRGDWWYGVVGDRVLKVRQIARRLESENADLAFVEDYFGLTDDLQRILSSITKDKHIGQAVEAFRGLRILHQEPWECLISYICATYKNVPAIMQTIQRLSKSFGSLLTLDGQQFFAFPTPESLANSTVRGLEECGLGYRARYVSETARRIHETGLDLGRLRRVDREEARRELLNLPGVGPKVADCVLLFSLGKLEAFPVDVRIRRALLRHYSEHLAKELVKRVSDGRSLSSSEYEKLSRFGREYFGEYAGYAQEYLYHYERIRG